MRKNFLYGVLSMMRRPRIVQIGAFDGIMGDPIHKYLINEECEALLIEPQEVPFEKLKDNYKGQDNITLFKTAISSVCGEVKMYRSPSARRRGWSCTCSLDKQSRMNRNAKALNMDVDTAEKKLKHTIVQSMPLSKALSESKFGEPVDFLQVDCEGYDDEVIYACDIDDVYPEAINYECHLLPDDRYEKLSGFLKNAGYRLYRWSDTDECAIR